MSTISQSIGARADAREPTVHVQRLDEGAIAILTLDDSLRANAMSPTMGDAFSAAVRKLEVDPEVRAVIIQGAGKDFSIGGHRDMLIDLGSGRRSTAELKSFMLAFYDRWLPLIDLPVPVISVLQGDCIGVAPVFACASDIAVADETLNLQITFASLGFYPGMALPELLLRKVNTAQAALLMMANEPISGREAERIGLIERCVPAGQGAGEALRIARAITASAPGVVRKLKAFLRLHREDLIAELDANASQQACDFQTDEYRERVARYLPNHYL